MSLQVWLPLNGNLDNQGLAPITINSNNISYDEGKMGKAAQFNSSYIGIDNTPLTGSIEDFSLCFWLKVSSTSSGMCLYNGRAAIGEAIALFVVGGVFRFDDGSQHTISYTVPTNKWEHYCFTRNASQIKLYVNGELKITTASTSYSTTATKATIGASSANTTTGHSNSLLGSLNDYRIYDHCLSEKEVREIAKGLVLHYKLNGNGCGGENLLKNTNTESTSYFGLSEQTGGSTKNIVYEDGVPCVQVTRNDTAHSGWGFLWYNSLELNKIKTNTIYTVSFDIKASVSGVIGFTGILNGNATNYMTNSTTSIQNNYIANQWCHIIFNCKTINDFSSITIGSQVVYFGTSGLTDINTVFAVKNFKLEEGAIATPWSPNPADIQYSSYGYGNNIEWDCSGFGNNGTKTGTITKDTNSPRYDGCYKFDNDSYIEHPALPSMNYATYSFWVKQSSFTGYGMIYGQKNNPSSGNIPWFAENTESAPAWAYFGSNSPNYTKSSGSLLTANTWHHLCYVWNNGVAKWYINGVPNATQITYTTRTNIPNGVIGTIGDSYTGTSWSGTPFSGNISDFRIYATALSDDDIKELYENKISIDSKENLWAYEFIEE